jgi:uncharacterized protein YebE (UPF0316 family)
MSSQGKSAVENGKKYENRISSILEENNINYERNVKYPKPMNKTGVGYTEFVAKGRNGNTDVRIEVKFQNIIGTAAEKFGTAFWHAITKMPETRIIFVIAGAAFDNAFFIATQREMLQSMLSAYKSVKDIRIISLEEFVEYINEI